MVKEDAGKEIKVSDVIFDRFIMKIQEDEGLKFEDETIEQDIRKIITELSLEKGQYQSNIEDALMYFGYRLREDNRTQEQTFQAHLEQDYGYVFYHLKLIYLLSIEMGEFVFDKLTLENSFYYLFKLKHVRACSIFSEILHLIKGGYGTGAMNRYRSLHELAVIAEFIYKNGEEAANAYLDYTEVMKVKDARYLLRLYGEDEGIKKVIADFEKGKKTTLEKKYGSKFVNFKSIFDYEWARPFLNITTKQNPSFGGISKVLNREKGKEQYKLSSNNIHSAPKSLISTLGSDNGLPIAGASNIGIAEPGSWAVYELQQINSILLQLIQKEEEASMVDILQTMLTMKLIQHLCNYVYTEFGRIERKLLQEENPDE